MTPESQNMGPGGAPMMGGPGPPPGGGNFFNEFYNQQDGMKMEGVQEGEDGLQIKPGSSA